MLTSFKMQITFLVSSKVMSLASPVLRKMFNGPWKEAVTVYPDGVRHLKLAEFDKSALRIVLNVLHFRNTDIPEVVPPETLAKIAVIGDYWECEPALAVVGNKWFQIMQTQFNHPMRYDRDLVFWIFLSSKFRGRPPIHNTLKHIAITTCYEPFQTCDLPIEEHKVGKLQSKFCTNNSAMSDT